MKTIFFPDVSRAANLSSLVSFAKTTLRAFVAPIAVSVLLTACGAETNKTMAPPPKIYQDRAQSSKIDGIYVFGDSLSDTGNFFTLANHLIPELNMRLEAPPSSPTGLKFSNKYLAPEYVATHYGFGLDAAWDADKKSAKAFHAHAQEKKHHVVRHILDRNRRPAQDMHTDAWKAAHNLVMKHSGGNNYAVANGTIGAYPGLTHYFYNKFRLREQVSLHARYVSRDQDTPKTLYLVMAGGNDLAVLLESMPADKDQDNIKHLAQELKSQVQRLQDLGARKILVATAPDLGIVPAFANTPLKERATQLSHMLDQEARRAMATFPPHRVRYMSLPSIIHKIKDSWAGTETAKKCVSRELKWEHFLATDGEISVEFTKECSAKALARGDFIYFDHFHGTDALYRQAARLYIDEIEILMNTRETLVGMGTGQAPVSAPS